MAESKPSFNAVIPAHVRYDPQLVRDAKLLYGEITALSDHEGYCRTSEKYFAKLYGVKKQTVGTWINALVDRGFIFVETQQKTLLIKIVRFGNEPKSVVVEKEINFEEVEIEYTTEEYNQFKEFYEAFSGVKNKLLVEFRGFRKHEDWKSELPKLIDGLMKYQQWRFNYDRQGGFVPKMQFLATWLKQRGWAKKYDYNIHGSFNKPELVNTQKPIPQTSPIMQDLIDRAHAEARARLGENG